MGVIFIISFIKAFGCYFHLVEITSKMTKSAKNLAKFIPRQKFPCLKYTPCYVAVCNNYAICNKLQTALNCNAVCNTSYFKLRCDDNAICNVLQIASKFYHLKILKMRKKNWSTAKWIASVISYYEFSQTPIYSSSACKGPNQHYNCSERYFKICPRTFVKTYFVRPSIGLFVRPSVCRENLNIAHIFWSIKDITLMFGMNDPWKKSFQLAPCRDLCFDLDLLQGQFILPARGQQLSELACKVYIYTVI